MIMAREARAAGARGLVRGDQRGGVDLEMAGRVGMDIGGRAGRADMAGRAEQQAAHFPVGHGGGMGQHGVQQRS